MLKLKGLVMVITLFFLFVSMANAAGIEKQCNMFTSQPNYSTMTLVVGDAVWENIPIVNGTTYKYTGFADAYTEFFNDVKSKIHASCDKYDVKGVVNLKINFAVTDKQYCFSAQYDYYK